MADDLEAFLRQAAQRRAARKKPSPVARSQPQGERPQPQRQQPQRRQPQRPAEPEIEEVIEIVDAQVVPEPKSRLESHVDTSSFEQRAEHLGEDVGLADEQLVARLHRTFDHRVGSLDDGPGMPVLDKQEPASAMAGDLAHLLADPASLRNAIVLSEIITPPQHRW